VNKIKFWKSVICQILVCIIYKVFLEYVDLYLTSEWGRFYVGHPVELVLSTDGLNTEGEDILYVRMLAVTGTEQ
jgi:hypothetical protein